MSKGRMMMTNKTSYIYVCMIREETGIAKVARRITKSEYSHIAICLDAHLSEFITFSRRHYYLPLNSGFMRETRNCFGDMNQPNFKAKIFKIPIASNELLAIEALIDEIEQDDAYLFNIFSMITMPIIGGFELYKAYNCLGFVGRVLEEVSSVEMDKPFYKYSIPDFDKLLMMYTYFEDLIDKDDHHVPDYMKKFGFLTHLRVTTRTLGHLFIRLFRRHKTV